MKTKIVYAVTSDETDYYLEQTLVSVYSLRLYNPEARVVLIVDEKTNDTLTGKRTKILEYISEKVVVNIPAKYTKKERSRYLKTTIRQHIEGAYLFIDSDTIITDNLSDIDSFNGNIGAVKDRHVLICENPYEFYIRKDAKKIGWEISVQEYYFNSGIFYVKDNMYTKQFYAIWHETWKRGLTNGVCVDQPSIAKTNQTCNYLIKELNGIWNCQISGFGLQYLYNAKIIHYYSSTWIHKQNDCAFIFYNKSIYQKIRHNGAIYYDVEKLIKNAKSAFSYHCQLVSGKQLDFLQTDIVEICAKIYFHYPTLYKIINSFFHTLNLLWKKYRQLHIKKLYL